MDILYSCIHSDHHPVFFCLDCDIVPESNTSDEADNTTKLKVNWNNLRPDQVHEYTKCTNIELSQFRMESDADIRIVKVAFIRLKFLNSMTLLLVL